MHIPTALAGVGGLKVGGRNRRAASPTEMGAIPSAGELKQGVTKRRKPRRRFPVEVLSPAEVMRLIGAVKGPVATAARNRAILALAYRSGLRIGEVLALCPKDVDAAAGSIRVLNGKGGRSRTVGVDAGAVAILATWLAVRTRYGVGDGAPLFCTRSGRAVTTAYIRRLFPTSPTSLGSASASTPTGYGTLMPPNSGARA